MATETSGHERVDRPQTTLNKWQLHYDDRMAIICPSNDRDARNINKRLKKFDVNIRHYQIAVVS